MVRIDDKVSIKSFVKIVDGVFAKGIQAFKSLRRTFRQYHVLVVKLKLEYSDNGFSKQIFQFAEQARSIRSSLNTESSLNTSSLATSSLNTSSLATSSLATSSLATSSLAPSSLATSSLAIGSELQKSWVAIGSELRKSWIAIGSELQEKLGRYRE
ncbi:hypothetical protein Rs2_17139 [Raphanus sativus]|nr:hypothetical protein Rs2_17139 [Raphanus sativus]